MSTGNVPSLTQPATAPTASSGGSSSETNGTVVDRQQRVHGDERARHHRVAVGTLPPASR